MRELTELDFCVLGVIWRFGPLSSYAVRKVFRTSRTAGWSSSSGSIYPSIRRLLAADLAAASTTDDRRGTTMLNATPGGVARLKAWIGDLKPELGTATPDPIRTRAQFLASLSGKERAEFVAAATKVTLQALRSLQDAADGEDDQARILDQLGILGATLELQGRIEWLERVGRILSDPADNPVLGAGRGK